MNLGYTAMREQYMRNGDAFLLFYSVIDRASFENIAFIYSSILRVKNLSKCPMILVALKNCINVDLAFHEAVRLIRYLRDINITFDCIFKYFLIDFKFDKKEEVK